METISPLGCHHNGFAATHAVRYMMYGIWTNDVHDYTYITYINIWRNIYKYIKVTDQSIYRPISLLLIFSKTVEKVFYDQNNIFSSKENYLSWQIKFWEHLQWGFFNEYDTNRASKSIYEIWFKK